SCTMLSSGLPPVFLLLTALELSWSLSDEEKKIILDGHNKYRSQVSPPAMDMLKMSWDTELEAFAQAYAEKCIWDHNKERGRRGENLFAMAPTLDLEFAVEDWNGEEKYYNLTTSTCVPGQMCGHYTQVVWASTHRIGCGAKFCEKIDGIETEGMYLLVCNYYPPGNMKGRKPYKEGPSCSQCPEGRACVNSLCGNFSFVQIFPSNSKFSSLLPAGALDTEELETNSDQTSMDQPTAGAPSTCLGLSLFFLPSVILVGLLL
ncbi:PI16 inhibitor, partial [Grus americana]|nr:PI16 inhibitor [Grus americana]